jgi:hypothetical protein
VTSSGYWGTHDVRSGEGDVLLDLDEEALLDVVVLQAELVADGVTTIGVDLEGIPIEDHPTLPAAGRHVLRIRYRQDDCGDGSRVRWTVALTVRTPLGLSRTTPVSGASGSIDCLPAAP